MIEYRLWKTACPRAKRRFVVAVRFTLSVALLTTGTFSNKAHAQDTVNTTSQILQSLALVVAEKSKGIGLGTGFCFWSTSTKSYFVTNQHVISDSSGVFLRPPNSNKLLPARIYPRPADKVDLAVLVVDVGALSCAIFSGIEGGGAAKMVEKIPPGTPVGVAGYPAIRFKGVGQTNTDVTPSVHFGTLSAAIDPNAELIEFDALIDHGNSGGPLFEVKTGKIVGVVTSYVEADDSRVHNNFAIPASVVKDFLWHAYLPHKNGTSNNIMDHCSSKYSYDDRGCCGQIDKKLVDEWIAEQKRWCNLPDAVP
jgi:S1-C subfamily serine protease